MLYPVVVRMNSCTMYGLTFEIRIVIFVILGLVFSVQCPTNNNKIFYEIIFQLFGGIYHSALVRQKTNCMETMYRNQSIDITIHLYGH